MAEYIEAGKADEIAEGGMKTYEIQGKDILAARYEGQYYAMGRYCTHMGADLSKGTLEGNIITCPRHGSRFDITTGESTSGPKLGFLKIRTKKEPSYPLKVEDGIIKIKVF
jgi:3-phenylpropionate/trans-cinnamate dioxygenase ferredoxin component